MARSWHVVPSVVGRATSPTAFSTPRVGGVAPTYDDGFPSPRRGRSPDLQRRAVDGGDSGAPLFRVGDDRVDVHAGQLAVAQLRLAGDPHVARSEEHTSELQSLMRTSYAAFCLKKNKNRQI